MNTIIEHQLSQASFEVFEEFQARIEKENISKNLPEVCQLRTDPDVVVEKMAYYVYYQTHTYQDCHKTRRQISRVATALGEMMANEQIWEMMANNDFMDVWLKKSEETA
tara:strand:+ start:421 stop:747 length:327 start_codon:yes stop_codon:yes gene_type:complete